MVGETDPDDSVGPIFRALENGTYEPLDCPTGRCPRVRIAEIPYERQVDETDDAYALRLRTRSNAATQVQNHSELYAIMGALQYDIGIPENGITVPCETLEEWEALAWIQGVELDAWTYAERASLPASEEEWFSDNTYDETLSRYLREKLTYQSGVLWTEYEFIGPDGLIYSTTRYAEGSGPHNGAITLPESALRNLYIQLSTGMGLILASDPTLSAPVQFGNLQTMEPPMRGIRAILFEYESEEPPSEADHGENILVADLDPRSVFPRITGPLNSPTGRPRVTIGVSPHRPRPTVRVAANKNRAPFPQWLRDRFARGKAHERRVLSEQDLAPNTTPIRDSKGRTTVPDSLTGGIHEVKDRLAVYNSAQIQAQMDIAKSRGVPYTLHVGPNTHISPTVHAQAKSTGITFNIQTHSFLGRGDN